MPSLENFTMGGCINVGNPVIDAPNLKSFCLFGEFHGSLSFKRCPCLSTFIIVSDSKFAFHPLPPNPINMKQVFSYLPVIDHFHVGNQFLRDLVAGCEPKMVLDARTLRKRLEMHDVRFSVLPQFAGALCLILSSPNLQELVTSMANKSEGEEPFDEDEYFGRFKEDFVEEDEDNTDAENEDSVLEFLGGQDLSDISIDLLQNIEMFDFLGTKPQLELFKLLLEKSPQLQKAHIHFKWDINMYQEERVLKEMKQFQQASQKAKVIISKSPEYD